MLTSTGRSLGRFAAVVLGGIGISMLAGCGDTFSYTVTTKQEGMSFYQQGAYIDAAGAFQNVVRSEPRDYEARYYLASSHARMGNYQQAIQSYRATLDAMDLTFEGKRDHAFRATVVDGLAQAIAGSEQRHIELEQLETEARTKSSAELYMILAKSYRYAGDPDTALNRYSQAALLAPDNAQVLKEYGLFLEQVGQVETALTPLRRSNAIDPEDVEVANALRRHGIVPGPSLKEREELAKPLMPTGPIPDVDWKTIGRNGGRSADATDAPPAAGQDGYPVPSPTVQPPRD